ncbi:rabphilin-3A-like [Manis pentadactyla]|uniref:rabphilin-3A-like n=1 Tax=Manis pentadactyla TaxID=143292 RepID=UPI00255C9439|nr:rabphilin-3A-like [Manis pentadactyla]
MKAGFERRREEGEKLTPQGHYELTGCPFPGTPQDQEWPRSPAAGDKRLRARTSEPSGPVLRSASPPPRRSESRWTFASRCMGDGPAPGSPARTLGSGALRRKSRSKPGPPPRPSSRGAHGDSRNHSSFEAQKLQRMAGPGKPQTRAVVGLPGQQFQLGPRKCPAAAGI